MGESDIALWYRVYGPQEHMEAVELLRASGFIYLNIQFCNVPDWTRALVADESLRSWARAQGGSAFLGLYRTTLRDMPVRNCFTATTAPVRGRVGGLQDLREFLGSLQQNSD